MATCWASCIGGCEGKSSREHMISKGLFISPALTVHGLSWCKDEPKTVGIEALTKKILCETHNSGLSPVDSGGGAAFGILREQTKLAHDRRNLVYSTLLKVERFHIDAKLLERWFLKTLLNLTCESEFLIGESGTEPGVAPADLVKICYGLGKFSGEAGMYVAVNIGMSLTMEDTVKFSPLLTADHKRVMGGFFEFRGIRFFLDLSSVGFKLPLNSIAGLDPAWANAQLNRPFTKMRAKHGRFMSHIVEFHW